MAVLPDVRRRATAVVQDERVSGDEGAVVAVAHGEDAQGAEDEGEWVLFGHHFAAIAGAGPLVGPTLYLDCALMAIFVVGVVLVLADVARRCWRTARGAAVPREAFGAPVTSEGVPLRCC